jgi:flagellin-specific chaperone FliS
LVSVWQIIGRLVRGGVPCIVHFLDAKFAPQSVDSELDNERTSLLVGIIKELQLAIEPEDKQPWEKTLAKSLYGAFFNALKQTKDLRYDQ